MSVIERQLCQTLQHEKHKRDQIQTARLARVQERFDRLVESGAVELERYKLGSSATYAITPQR